MRVGVSHRAWLSLMAAGVAGLAAAAEQAVGNGGSAKPGAGLAGVLCGCPRDVPRARQPPELIACPARAAHSVHGQSHSLCALQPQRLTAWPSGPLTVGHRKLPFTSTGSLLRAPP